MADTTRWSLQDCANAAGKRRHHAPAALATAPDEHLCRGCGIPLDGQRTKTGLLRVYCSQPCMQAHTRVYAVRPDDEAHVRMAAYYWGEW